MLKVTRTEVEVVHASHGGFFRRAHFANVKPCPVETDPTMQHIKSGSFSSNGQLECFCREPRSTQEELESLLSRASRAADGPVHTVEYDPFIKSQLASLN